MRAVQITSYDGPAAIEVTDLPAPVPSPSDVLIDVAAAGVSFPDVLQSRGLYQLRPPLPYVPGAEVSGAVLSAPDGSGLDAGDRVCAIGLTGGFAEQVVVPAGNVFLLPDEVSFEAGAALPMNYLTVHFALTTRGRLEAGDKVLVHGAAGGIGTAGIQYAKALGAEVIAVVSTQDKAEVARRAGAGEIVLADGFKDAVMDLTSGRGVDIVLDPVGGDRFTDSLRCLAPQGRLLVVGFTGGSIPEVRVNRLLLNNIDVVGVGWGHYLMSHPGFAARQWEALVPYLRTGDLDPIIDSVYDLSEAADALAVLDDRRVAGKVLLMAH